MKRKKKQQPYERKCPQSLLATTKTTITTIEFTKFVKTCQSFTGKQIYFD